ncbi:MAG: hypothetical protein ACYC1U_11145 [Candidatus Aquicultorales bacterium]
MGARRFLDDGIKVAKGFTKLGLLLSRDLVRSLDKHVYLLGQPFDLSVRKC